VRGGEEVSRPSRPTAQTGSLEDTGSAVVTSALEVMALAFAVMAQVIQPLEPLGYWIEEAEGGTHSLSALVENPRAYLPASQQRRHTTQDCVGFHWPRYSH